jgi:hypothetical protein
LINHCAVADKCKNGGTCQTLANGIGFQCQCMPGYSGDNCETNNNDCATANCPSSATCIDVVNAHYCRCRLGFTGEDCARGESEDVMYYHSNLPFIRLIGSYICSWERPGDLPQVIEILCLFASGAQRNERKDATISITSGRSPGLSQQRM